MKPPSSAAASSSFFGLTPDHVLNAVELSQVRCTGRCMALNSFENRVYDVELEDEQQTSTAPNKNPRLIAKFYRPSRWSYEQIMEEHGFLQELREAEIPVVAPLAFPDGKTLHQSQQAGIWFALFPRVGGRAPDELSDEQLLRIGRLLGRIHLAGSRSTGGSRLSLNPSTYGTDNLALLLDKKCLPLDLLPRYVHVVAAIVKLGEELFRGVPIQRIHGDCHLGNLLWNDEGPFFLDFDDMVFGPWVQDVWLLTPGRDPESLRQRQVLLAGYEEFHPYRAGDLRLVEVLRALRFIHYAAWLARRWEDPLFPLSFPQFGTYAYWSTQIQELEEQLELIHNRVVS